TMTAQATILAQKMATAQTDLATARAQIRDLTARLNAGAPQPTAITANGTAPDNSGNSVPGAVGTQQAQSSNGFSFAEVVTAKGIDESTGCATTKSSTFSVNDNRIYVVGDVRNFKSGTNFVAKWAGGDLSRENDWTSKNSGNQICIFFYIEPKTVGLKAGT